MKKSYVFEQLQWDELKRISQRLAEVDFGARNAMAEYREHIYEDGARERWILALGVCASVCEVHGERLRELMSQVTTVYDLQQGIGSYAECLNGPHLYPVSPDREDPEYCPECMPESKEEIADRIREMRMDAKRDEEAERSMG